MVVALCILILICAVMYYIGTSTDDISEGIAAIIVMSMSIGIVVLAVIILIIEIWSHVSIVVK